MIDFYKYENCGNDFIIFDGRKELFSLDKKKIVKLCNRNLSIGADGILLCKSSKIADYKLEIFNSDGSKASMCGNGLISFVRFLSDHIEKRSSYSIETTNGVYKTKINKNLVSFLYSHPKLLKENIKLQVEDKEYILHLVDSGTLHGVIFAKDIKSLDVDAIGRKIRKMKMFFPGINVNFCEGLNVRTYEKGVEKETLGCGTGAIAVSYCLLKNQNKKSFLLNFKGGKVKVSYNKNKISYSSKPNFCFAGKISF